MTDPLEPKGRSEVYTLKRRQTVSPKKVETSVGVFPPSSQGDGGTGRRGSDLPLEETDL